MPAKLTVELYDTNGAILGRIGTPTEGLDDMGSAIIYSFPCWTGSSQIFRVIVRKERDPIDAETGEVVEAPIPADQPAPEIAPQEAATPDPNRIIVTVQGPSGLEMTEVVDVGSTVGALAARAAQAFDLWSVEGETWTLTTPGPGDSYTPHQKLTAFADGSRFTLTATSAARLAATE